MSETTHGAQAAVPLTPAVFSILLALADGEKHGYAIMQEVDAKTQGQMKMGPGTLYGSIKRMLAAHLIEESDERPDPNLDDQRHRHYRLTGHGARALRLESRRLVDQIDLVRLKGVFDGSGQGEPHMVVIPSDSRTIRLSGRLYRVMLSVYPHGFRDRFAPLMLRVFRDDCLESHSGCLATHFYAGEWWKDTRLQTSRGCRHDNWGNLLKSRSVVIQSLPDSMARAAK